MAPNHNDQKAVRQYLLRQLSETEQRTIEQRLLADDDLYEELEIAEDELMDEYLSGKLSMEELQTFERRFLASPERKQQLRTAQAFRRYASGLHQKKDLIEPPNASSLIPWRRFFERSHLAHSPLALAAMVLIAVGFGFAIWRGFFYQTDVDKSLIALNNSYRQQRPVEARITQFNYAPFVTRRGPGTNNINETERQRAELILLEALNKKPTPAVHHALGKVYLAKNDFDHAIEQFEEALQADPNNAQIYGDLGAAFLEKGKLELDKGKSDRASAESGKGLEDLGRSLANLSKALELNPSLLEALFNRALCHRYMMLLEQAADDWREYVKKDSTSRWAEEARRNLTLLEEQKKRSSQTQERLFEEFLAAYARHDADAAWNAISHSRARTGNAVVERLLDDSLQLAGSGRAEEAQEQFQKLSYVGAVESEKVGDRYSLDLARFYKSTTWEDRTILTQARRLMRLGGELYNRAEYTQAIATFSKARNLFLQTGDEGELLFAEAWIGYSYLRLPDPEKSGQTFERLSKIFEERNYRSLFAQSLLAEADALNTQNEFSRVLEQANRALAVSEQIQDDANAVRCLQANTSMQLIMGNYRESLAATFQALNLADKLPADPKLRWPFYHEASLDFYFLGMPETALQFENEALRIAASSGLSLHVSRSYDRRALIFERLQNYGEAMRNNNLARAEAQKIGDERIRTNILAHATLRLGDLYRESGELKQAADSYDQALYLYAKLNLDTYQYRAHKGKLLTLIAANDDAAAEAELSTVLYWFEQNRRKIAEENYRNKFFDTDQNTYEIAVDFQYSRKKDPVKAFDYAESYRARSLLDLIIAGGRIEGNRDQPELKLSSSGSPLKLDQIRERLPKDVQLLQYSVLDDKTLIWVVTRDGLRSAQANISRRDLEDKIRGYVLALSQGDTNNNAQVVSKAKELYTALVGPAEGYLNSKLQLCIIPDDVLDFLPFASLISPASGRYLLEDFTLETSPSATTFVMGSEQAALMKLDGRERLLIVGNPYFDREQFDVPDLPAAKREAEKIADLYGAVPLLGSAAVATRVKTLLKDAEVIHFASHAIPDERSPLLSKLLLARDGPGDAHHASPGFLQASEIYSMKLPHTRLVVLSACQTGIERMYRGEGAIGLARPFLAAGVPIVVASLWPVESESTAELMISFHKHRKQDHVSTAEALRRAQLEHLHNESPNSPRDYGWAAFVTIGSYANF